MCRQADTYICLIHFITHAFHDLKINIYINSSSIIHSNIVTQVRCVIEIIRHLYPFLPPQMLLCLFHENNINDDDSRRRVVYAAATQTNHTVSEIILPNIVPNSRITRAFHLIPPSDPFNDMLPDDDDDIPTPNQAQIFMLPTTIQPIRARARRFVPLPVGENRHPNLM